jgi:hypothetical protein
MRLVSITLNDIRRFTDPVRISGIGSGLNVLSAPNENGKSTLFDALQAVFFAPHRSNGRDIKALKPHAGGAPEVSVEVDIPEGRFRIFKRWSSRAAAEVWQGDRLVAKADEAEAWIAKLTNSGAEGGPAGLLWVRQGMTQLDHDKAKENQGTLTTRRDLMSSVTGEVEALTGGRRMDMALTRARADLAPLQTASGRSKADGPLAKAEQDVATLTKRQAELEDIARHLSDALKRRTQIRRDLAELLDPAAVTERKRRLTEATAACDAARRHAEALGRAEVDVQMARLQVNEAAAKLAALATARDTAARARKASVEAQNFALASQASLAQADLEAQTRQANVAAAATLRSDAEAVSRRAMRAETARGAEARRLDLTARRTTIATWSADLAAQRQAATLGPDAKAMAALEVLGQEVSVLCTMRTRAATRITMRYSGAQRLSVSESELPEGQPTPILTDATLVLPGLGHLTIHPGESTDTATLQKAEAGFAAMLARIGQPTVETARAAATLRAEAAAKVKDLETRIATLAPKGIAAIEAELAQLPEPVDAEADLPGLAEAEANLDTATEALALAERARDAARARAELERLAEARAGVSLQAAVSAVVAAEAALVAFGDLSSAEAGLSATRDSANLALTTALDHHASLEAIAPDLALAEAALARAASVAKGADSEINTLSEERAGLDKEIDLRSGEGVAEDLADVSARLIAAEAQLARLLFEVAVLKELIAALEVARNTARERYFEPVMAELKPLLRLLWPDAELKFDGESLLPTALIRNGLEEDIGILSGGTQEQIALFVRLAFARLLAKTGRHAPVILDDALVYTDDDRIERVFDALHGQANDLQIIVLSCRQRAFRDLGGQKLTFVPVGVAALQS